MRPSPAALILLAPLLFGVHILEETPRFVYWFNSLGQPPITERGFVIGNIQPLVITIVLAACAAWVQRREPAWVLFAWLSYLMFANTLFHVAATVALRRYCPGLFTAAALYAPFFVWYTRYVRTRYSAHAVGLCVVSGLAAGVVYLQWHKVLFQN